MSEFMFDTTIAATFVHLLDYLSPLSQKFCKRFQQNLNQKNVLLTPEPVPLHHTIMLDHVFYIIDSNYFFLCFKPNFLQNISKIFEQQALVFNSQASTNTSHVYACPCHVNY